MQRTPNVPSRPPAGTSLDASPSKSAVPPRTSHDQVGSFWDMLAIRLIFVAVCVAAGFHFKPFGMTREYASLTGLLFALAVIMFEIRLGRGGFGGVGGASGR